MEQPVFKNTNEKHMAPSVVETVPPEHFTKIEKTPDGSLLINGTKTGKYGYVDNLKKQSSGIYSFNAVTSTDKRHIHFIDPEDKEASFPQIDIDQHTEQISVKGFPWKSLSNKKVFSGGYRVAVDPVTKNLVFRTITDNQDSEQEEVVVNNIPWKNKFTDATFAEMYNGTVVAIGKKKDKQAEIYVNDAHWAWPASHDEQVNRHERFKSVKTNGHNIVAGVLVSSKTGKSLEHVLVGDDIGSKKEWTTAFDIDHENFNTVAVDAKSDTVAAIGMIAGVPTLVINDIPCKLSSEPQLVEKFRIEDGVVFIQYINANGDKVAEKVSLVEDAHEVKKHREESKQTDDAFSMLRELMHKHKNITAISLLEALLKNGDLQNELAKEKEITKKVYELQNSNHVLESDKKMLAADNQTLVNGLEDARKEITELKETIKSLALLVEEHKPGGKKIFGGSGDKMTEALYKKFLGLLGDKKVELAQKEEEISGKGGISEKVKRSDGFEIKF